MGVVGGRFWRALEGSRFHDYRASPFWKKNAAASNLCYYLSLLAADPQKAGTLLKEALKRNASNYPAWQALTKRNAKRSEKEKLVLLEQFKEAFSGNPTMWEYFLKKNWGLIGKSEWLCRLSRIAG